MHFIPLSNEQAHMWVNLLFAESFGLTRVAANTPRFPKVEIQQCDINRAAAAQNSPSFLKHLCTVVGCHFFEHLVRQPWEGHSCNLVWALSKVMLFASLVVLMVPYTKLISLRGL